MSISPLQNERIEKVRLYLETANAPQKVRDAFNDYVENVERLERDYSQCAGNLQEVVQELHLGYAGAKVDEIVCAELRRLFKK